MDGKVHCDMNWDALGAVAELVGAVGVVASLLYVAREMRSGNRAAAVQAKLETARFMTDFGDLLLQKPDLEELMRRGQKSLGSLSPEEFLQFTLLALKAFWFFSAGHFQFRQRTLAENDWFELRAVMRFWLRTQGCQEWWQTSGRPMFGDEFAAFVESEISDLAAERGAVAAGAQPGAPGVVRSSALEQTASAAVGGGPAAEHPVR